MWNIADARAVVETRTAREIDTSEGRILLDLFTASAVVAVYDALSPANQASAVTLPLTKFANFAFKRVS